MKYFILTMALLVMAVRPAQAQVERYEFDKAHTQIMFAVNHLGFSNSHGKFLDFDGYFEFNRGEPEKSKVEVTINTAGINMDDEKWDEHLKGADFFNVEKYPTMTFKSTKIEVTGENTAKISGDLTILDKTNPVTLDVIFNKADKSPFGEKYVAGFSAKAGLKRSDYGMNYGLPMVGDDVSIMIEVEGIRQGGDVVNP
ncbi:MAG TPA: YceI family protein [Alphaproteobacteria bacterium]|nr:YceI family protein [Alphaproteobacteria bacterium]